jgi:mannobiose 2-epimerase
MRFTPSILAAPIAGALITLATLPLTAPAQKPERPKDRIVELTDELQRQAILRKVDDLVRRELTEHWYPHAVDSERGGFHQTMARDWSLGPDQNVFVVYQARMAWTAAAFAEYSPPHRDAFVRFALHGTEFLDRVVRDHEQGGFHWVLDAKGRIDPRQGDEKHAYGTAFVVYAAAKVRGVTGDQRALKVAQDAFDWLERHAHDAKNGGYYEALRRDGTPITSWDPDAPMPRRLDRVGVYYGFKSMNVHIHLLEALAELSKVDRRPLVKERLREVYDLVSNRIAVEPGALNLYLTPDWRAIPAHDSFGHDVETAYLLVEAAEALGIPDDPATWRMARLLVDHALDWGWDEVNGGFYDKGESFGGTAFAQNKVWWTEAEGLNALLMLHVKYGATTDRYWKAFLKQWDFIEKYLIDPVHGGWYSETTRDGKLVGDGAKASQWKANYHTSRALMNVARMLRKAESDDPWSTLSTGTESRLRGLCVVSDKVVWASGANGTVVRTVDGGTHWTTAVIPDATDLDFRDVHAFDDQRAFLLSIGKGENSRIYQTVDGGASWNIRFHNRDPKVFLDAIEFWDAGHGIAVGDPVDGRFTILTTEDGGASWSKPPQAEMPAALAGEGAFAASGTCLVVQGNRNAWFGTGGADVGRVFRSTDGGRTWTVHPTPIPAGNASSGIFSLAFWTASAGVAVGGDYKRPELAARIVATTSDGGRLWTCPEGHGPGGFRSAVVSAQASSRPALIPPVLIAVGPTGSDLSTDGGIRWAPLGNSGFHAAGSAGSTAGCFAAGEGGTIARFTGRLHLH